MCYIYKTKSKRDAEVGVEDAGEVFQDGAGAGGVGICQQTVVLPLQKRDKKGEVETVGAGSAGLAALDAAQGGVVHSKVLIDEPLMGVPDSHDGLIGDGQRCFGFDVCFHSL